MKIYSLLLLLFISSVIFGQKGELDITVLDAHNVPLEYVTVQLVKKSTNNLIEAGYSQTDGKIQFHKIQEGQYILKSSFIGFETFERQINYPLENNVVIILKESVNKLDEVTVSAVRKVITREEDNLIMKIGGGKDLGVTAKEILSNSPGIIVNGESIEFLGKEVIIEINGRQKRLSGLQLIRFLESLQSENILSIELIANPGVDYAADFDGRIISIKTKKLKDSFMTSIGGGVNQRSKDLSSWAGSSINGSVGKVDFFGSFRYDNSKHREELESIQELENISSHRIGDFNSKNRNFGPQYEGGIDLEISNSSIIGVKFEGYSSRNNSFENGNTKIYSNNFLDSITQFTNDVSTDSKMHNLNLNYFTVLDTLGGSLTIDLDYGNIKEKIDNDQLLSNFNSLDENSSNSIILQNVNSKSKIYGIKGEFSKKILGANFNFGLQYNLTKINQKLLEDSPYIPNSEDGDDTLLYDESIYGIFSSVKGKLNIIDYTLGLRSEYTAYKGTSEEAKVNRDYINFFPNIKFSYKSKNHYYSLSYNKNIKRPKFKELIPFKRYTGPFSYYTGNPDLRAFFYTSYEGYYSYKNALWFNILYRYSSNRILEYDRLILGSDLIEGSKENNGKSNKLQVGLGYNKKVRKWFNISSSFRYNIGNESFISDVGNTQFDYNSYTIYVSPRLNFKSLNINPSFYYSSDTYYSVSQNLNYWYFNLTVSKSLFKNNAQLSFIIQDLFLTGITRRVSDYNNIYLRTNNNWDSRQFKINFIYSFRGSKSKSSRNRRGANDNPINRF